MPEDLIPEWKDNYFKPPGEEDPEKMAPISAQRYLTNPRLPCFKMGLRVQMDMENVTRHFFVEESKELPPPSVQPAQNEANPEAVQPASLNPPPSHRPLKEAKEAEPVELPKRAPKIAKEELWAKENTVVVQEEEPIEAEETLIERLVTPYYLAKI